MKSKKKICISRTATGCNIKRLMKKEEYSVQDLQEACGLAAGQAVYKWLKGQSKPSIDSLLVLAKVFGVTLDDIVVAE